MLKILVLVTGQVHALNPELDKIRKHIAMIEAEVEARINDSRAKRRKTKSNASDEGATDNLMALLVDYWFNDGGQRKEHCCITGE